MTLYESLLQEIRTAFNGVRVALDARPDVLRRHRGISRNEVYRRLYYLEGLLAAWALITNANLVPTVHPVVFDTDLLKAVDDELGIDLAALRERVEQS